MKYLLVVFWSVVALLPSLSFANDIRIENIKITNNGTLECTVVWSNSWFFNSSDNLFRDGAWCFVKYRSNEGRWKHLDISSLMISSENANTKLMTTQDQKGFFLTSEKNGEIQEKITVVLPEDINNQNGVHDVAVFAIEMVWIDEGSFYVGDGVASQNALRSGNADTTIVEPYLVSSEAAIKIGTSENQLYSDPSKPWTPQSDIPEGFPKGYQGFWLMKYEINQSQYVQFLNTLPLKAQENRTSISPESDAQNLALAPENVPLRNAIFVKESGSFIQNRPAQYGLDANQNGIFEEENDGLYRACNWLNAYDVAAFLDWAALRPITELEFEKAARGLAVPQKGEFAWGTPFIVDANSPTQDATAWESVEEVATDSAGLAPYNTGIQFPQLQGVLRNGFGANESGNRLQAGASYWGVLELSGNVWEMCLRVNNSEALNFDRSFGDGNLDEKGEADAWQMDMAEALMVRGGAWDSVVLGLEGFRDLSVSARFYATLSTQDRRGTTGGRGGR